MTLTVLCFLTHLPARLSRWSQWCSFHSNRSGRRLCASSCRISPAMAKSNSAGHLGTLEKYHDEMGWVVRWLGDIPPGRITPQYVHGAVLMKPSSQGARTGISSTPKKSRHSQPSPKKSRKTGL
jgi:hypothetical protein